MTVEASRVVQVRSTLLAELRAGSRRPGEPINVKEVAATLRLSATPVREALERLTGEGVVVVTGDRHGFAAARLRPKDLAGYHELLAMMADSAIRRGGDLPHALRTVAIDEEEPALSVERLFDVILALAPNRATSDQAVRIANILAPYRRVEPATLANWSAELSRFTSADRPTPLLAALRALTRTRRVSAADLVEAAEQ